MGRSRSTHAATALFAIGMSLGGATPASADVPVTLRGSSAAMERQHTVARELGFAFVRTPAEMARLEAEGELVRLEGNEDYGLREGVASLVARPEMRTFIERLARDYRAACGEPLVVTSLTRPTTRQPRNAHRLSVHPAGIAVDLRVSRTADCRAWLEDTLLAMEEEGVLDVTRERSPPHYHVALFPDAYMAHIQPALEAERARVAREILQATGRPEGPGATADERGGRTPPGRGFLLAALLPAALGLVLNRRRRPRQPGT